MEIDFLIQWNKKASDQTNLAVKVKEMMNLLFLNVTDDTFDYNSDDTSLYSLNYKGSEKNNKVFLKIISKNSDANSAKQLSAIRDLICNSEYRRNYHIICTYDEASLYYCCRLMEPMGTFERHLREFMYIIVVNAFGIDWVVKTFPKEMINEIKKKEKNGISDQKLSEKAFELLDFGQIIEYLFSERYFTYTAEQVLEEKLSDEKLNKLSRDEIVSVISNNRKITLWNKLFSNNNIECLNIETLDLIREKRNDIMHQHRLNEKNYNEILTDVTKTDNEIIQAIRKNENRIYTKSEKSIISRYLQDAFSGLTKLYSDSLLKKDWSIIYKAFSKSAKRMSEKSSIVQQNNYEKTIRAFQQISSSLPDISKYVETNHSSINKDNYLCVDDSISSKNTDKNDSEENKSDQEKSSDE